ncbi:MAG TPA: hypothetical protein VHE78_05795, partial [Gemmatimonadaceae bacterium]|nr:hypothetical protein [Gemmatimonadaceae bacterium]
RAMVVGAFGFRRKQMGRVVRELWKVGPAEASALLARAGIDSKVRPEVLTPHEFAGLLRSRNTAPGAA